MWWFLILRDNDNSSESEFKQYGAIFAFISLTKVNLCSNTNSGCEEINSNSELRCSKTIEPCQIQVCIPRGQGNDLSLEICLHIYDGLEVLWSAIIN